MHGFVPLPRPGMVQFKTEDTPLILNLSLMQRTVPLSSGAVRPESLEMEKMPQEPTQLESIVPTLDIWKLGIMEKKMETTI